MDSRKFTCEKLEKHNYVFQSGDYEGMSVLSLILGGEYLEMRQMLRRLGGIRASSHAQHIALNFWLSTIHKLKPSKICPICGKRAVHLFVLKLNGLNGFYQPEADKNCCDNKSCKLARLYGQGSPGVGLRVVDWTVAGKSLYDLRSNYNNKTIDPQWVTDVLRDAYELPDVLFNESASKEAKNQAAFAYMVKRLIKK